MNSAQIELVKSSWEQVKPLQEQAAALFYGRLFELDASLEPMFTGDIKEQGRKLMAMITLAVNGLEDLDRLVPAVQNLGRRHVGYGVRASHYETVGAALLWTLEQGLGDGFTPEVGEAWAQTYGILSTVMKDAALAA